MRAVLATLLLIVLNPLLWAGQQANHVDRKPAEKALPKTTTTVLYTGKLMGHFRIPKVQEFNACDLTKEGDCVPGQALSEETLGCPLDPDLAGDGDNAPNPDARNFLRIRRHDGTLIDDGVVLVGTGDNFAPKLEARVGSPDQVKEDGKEGMVRLPKDQYTWDWLDGRNRWVRTQELIETKVDRLPNRDDKDHYKELLKQIRQGRGVIPNDNVACFLAHAHYDAVVPGNFDFYFGPERLRYIGRLLASFPSDEDGPQKTGRYRAVQMLGANLVVRTTFLEDHKPIPDSQKRLKFRTRTDQMEVGDEKSKPMGDLVEISIKDGGFVLPYLQQVKVAAKDPTVAIQNPQLCAKSAPDPDQDDNNHTCLPLTPIQKPLYWLPKNTLKAGTNWAVCVSVTEIAHPTTTRDDRPYCVRFSVYAPFFEYSDGTLPLLGNQASSPPFRSPKPYAVKMVHGRRVAIFGVVNQEMRAHVGKLNFFWENEERSGNYKTEVEVLDPVDALRQLMQYFDRKECGEATSQPGKNPATNEVARADCDASGRFTGMKILLAQMPAAKAERIAALVRRNPEENAGLKFDLIVSDAQLEEATPGEEMVMTPDGGQPRTFVVTPPPFYNWLQVKPENPIQKVTIKEFSDGNAGDHREYSVCTEHLRTPDGLQDPWDPRTEVTDLTNGCGRKKEAAWQKPVPCNLWCQQALKALQVVIQKTEDKLSDCKGAQCLEDLTLAVMRHRTKADVALIQKRDFFWGTEIAENAPLPGKDTSELQEALDRILWKGDFLQVLSVTGSTLKAVLQQSEKFAKEDKDELSLDHERDRSLLVLGADKDENDEFVIDGKPLDPGRLYTVATTDYVGLGDTGYPDLEKPPVGRAQRPREMEELQYISSLVCKELSGKMNASCTPRVDPEAYFDSWSGAPPDTRAGNTPGHQFGQWLRFWESSAKPLGPDDLRDQVQNRRIWTLSLEKANLSVNLVRHSSDTEKERNDKFGGLPIAQLGAARSTTLDFDQRFVATWAGAHVDFFASDDLRYAQKATRQNSAPTSFELTNNRLAFDAGMDVHRSKQLPRLSFEPSLHFETQPAPPFTIFKVGSGLRVDLPRRESFLARVGVRWQNRKSWIDFGYQAGAEFDSIRQFVFNPGAVNEVVCSPSAAQTVSDCVKANLAQLTAASPVRVDTNDIKFRNGLFLRFRWEVPLPVASKLTYVMENEGDLFFNHRLFQLGGDNSTDTRYRDIWKHSLPIPIFSNFTFEPKLEMFFFENKGDGNKFWNLQNSISINYSFTRSSGNKWKDALRYKPK